MIKVRHKGDFSKTVKYLKKINHLHEQIDFDSYGKEGVLALASATPVDSGVTAASWGYRIEKSSGSVKIIFTNSNVNEGVPIAIILQYGHASRNGTWVQGIDYINPALKPIFDRLADKLGKEVREA